MAYHSLATKINDSSDSECNYVGSMNIENSSDEEGGDEIVLAAGCKSFSEFDLLLSHSRVNKGSTSKRQCPQPFLLSHVDLCWKAEFVF
jgi:hypothetical protein